MESIRNLVGLAQALDQKKFVIGALSISFMVYVWRKHKQNCQNNLIYANTPLNREILKDFDSLKAFHPTPYLVNKYLQLMALVIHAYFDKFWPIKYERELVEMSDGAIIAVDWWRKDLIKPDWPLLVLHPGGAGDSQDNYVTSVIRAVGKAGIPSVVINFRLADDIPLKTPKLYCHGWTQDAREVIDRIRNSYKLSLLVGCGFSLGGNILTNFVGEEGDKCKLDALVSIGNPLDIYQQSKLQPSWLFRYVHQKMFITALSRVQQNIKGKPELKAAFEDMWNEPLDELLKKKYTFDDLLLRYLAPMFGYNAEDYYESVSSDRRLPFIKIPSLFIHAHDDVLVPNTVINHNKYASNPNLLLCLANRGTHICFYEKWLPKAWSGRVVTDYCLRIHSLHKKAHE
mmetsp:Transcript_33340/g.37869  ORF Transcript_33340/g.37869 Transcript_33340/m.37869 type:complete len:400 (+) Transcript_33340:55-1254(+)